MIQEEKSLLLKDLCARLPYNICVYNACDKEQTYIAKYDSRERFELCDGTITSYVNVIPYLRPMSSMTEEELKTFRQLQVEADESGTFEGDMLLYDWLNKNHFDYRLLIFQGLALEAPEGMYKTE